MKTSKRAVLKSETGFLNMNDVKKFHEENPEISSIELENVKNIEKGAFSTCFWLKKLYCQMV